MDSGGDAGAVGGLFAGLFGCVFMLIWLGLIVLMLASWWKIFVKAGKPGWAALVPIYNLIVLVEIIGKPVTWVIFLLIPCVNIVFSILLCLELAKKFGKDALFGLGLAFLGVIFFPMLAFGDAQYQGGGSAPAQ